MTVKTFTCITCPEGCEIRVELNETGEFAAKSQPPLRFVRFATDNTDYTPDE